MVLLQLKVEGGGRMLFWVSICSIFSYLNVTYDLFPLSHSRMGPRIKGYLPILPGAKYLTTVHHILRYCVGDYLSPQCHKIQFRYFNDCKNLGGVMNGTLSMNLQDCRSTKYPERTHIFTLLILFSQKVVFKDGQITTNTVTRPSSCSLIKKMKKIL